MSRFFNIHFIKNRDSEHYHSYAIRLNRNLIKIKIYCLFLLFPSATAILSVFLSAFKHRDSVGYSLFERFSSVFIDLGFILFTVCQASCTAYTSADACHSLDKITARNVFTEFQQSNAASLDSGRTERL